MAEDFYFFVTEMVPSTITRTLKHGVYWYSYFVMNLLGQYLLAEMPTIPATDLWNNSPLNPSVAIPRAPSGMSATEMVESPSLPLMLY